MRWLVTLEQSVAGIGTHSDFLLYFSSLKILKSMMTKGLQTVWESMSLSLLIHEFQ